MLKSVVLLVATLSSLNAFAEDKSDGCGVGWKIASKNSLLSTSTRGTTNGILPPTFSMTSGTSGCSQHSIVKNDKRGIHFAESNIDTLMVEMATGKGESVVVFANVLGCDAQSVPTFIKTMQSRYEDVFTTENLSAQNMLANVQLQIAQEKTLATGCIQSF